MPPTELIASARNGDAAAITSLLAVAQPDIRRYARATCRTADVDDAVQDALCLLHRHIGSLRAISAFSGWLFAVVRRECLRLARRGFGQAAPLEELGEQAEIAVRPDHELRLDLAAAIQSLPAHYREALVLRDLEELTIDEIAARLETTRETVKARLRRARTLAREYLAR
ncbi:RNA polymerase subunit sigma-24 [Devosia insulae DS-56]|uniref:RNA polymerase subunit sigma-24 n=1 Tax=Devosia insulae DS-56 TaxID=1116389 RepID=A0A1E5XPX1_9HYPH|nr:sigma-70 family RNA polymerase sigma factor [Devosia insulae]OEO30564.1 RNA polymerase subunit sigma-24 [Devosia insulae DS-56]